MPTDVPPVKDCTVRDCSFNKSRVCHASTITVGAEDGPRCNTFQHAGQREVVKGGKAGVEACRMHMCLRNRDLKCIAFWIKVGYRNELPFCLAFKNRYKEGTN